jgi:hypothetical protein
MMEKNPLFIYDPLLKEAQQLYEDVSKEIDKVHDPKAIFLKKFTLALIDAAGPRKLKDIKLELPEKNELNIKPTIRSLKELSYGPTSRLSTMPIKTPIEKKDFLTKPKIKTLPILQDKSMSIKKKEVLKEKKEPYSKTIKKPISSGEYKIKFKPKKEKFGEIDSLLMDKSIKSIHCLGPKKQIEVFINGQKEKTQIKFNTDKEINNLIKLFAKQLKKKISEQKPILEGTINENLQVQAVYGTDFINPRFVLKRV